jgi:hypothetical protein
MHFFENYSSKIRVEPSNDDDDDDDDDDNDDMSSDGIGEESTST